MAVLGELQLRLLGSGQDGDRILATKNQVIKWLGNATSLVADADVVLTNFPTLVQKSEPEAAQQVLRYCIEMVQAFVINLALKNVKHCTLHVLVSCSR